MNPVGISPTGSAKPVSCDQALKIARVDAEKAYRDLSPYRIVVVLKTDG